MCNRKFLGKNETQLLKCYIDYEIPKTIRYCDLLTKVKSWNIRQILECYDEISLNHSKADCDKTYDNIGERYICYERIGFKTTKDRQYCEEAHEKDYEAKYKCLDELGIKKKAEYCLRTYQDIEEK